jgi:glyoxylase-like metal-dependent hydrolase (beta-lactamase superfamily II)
VDGEVEILPGIRVTKVGGHTAGMQIVTVETARGRSVVASDAAHYYRNLDERIPFNTLHDLPGVYGAFDRVRELARARELIVPGHDPLVLERLRPVADGIVEL